MKIRAIIFDLYGTLLHLADDSKPYKRVIEAAGIDRRYAYVVACTNNLPTLRDFCDVLIIDFPNLTDLQKQLNSDVSRIEIYPDVIPTLEALTDQGYSIGVISNLASPYKQPFFNFSLDAFVAMPVFSCDCGLLKPNPAIYEMALKQLGLQPSEAMMVGDKLTLDVEGPRAVGMRALLLDRDRRTEGNDVIHSLFDLSNKLR